MISRVPTATIRQLAGELGRLIDAGAGDPADEHILKYARTLERQLLTVLDERHRAETVHALVEAEPSAPPVRPDMGAKARLESERPHCALCDQEKPS